MREVTHRIKKAEEGRSKPDALKLSYGLDFSMPNYDTVEQVDSKSHISLPNFKIPTVTIPGFKTPAIALPKIEMPSLQLTPLKDRMVEQWNVITKKSLLMTKNLSQQTLYLVNDYKHKNFAQILNNYRLRNAALIGLLIFIFVYMWLAHVRRQRKQALMLSAIAGTINTENNTQSPKVELPEGSNASDLVDQIEALITQDKIALPDAEDYRITEDLVEARINATSFSAHSKESDQETSDPDLNANDQVLQLYKQNDYR